MKNKFDFHEKKNNISLSTTEHPTDGENKTFDKKTFYNLFLQFMKLLTKELLETFKKTGSQEEIKDPIVIAKFFHSGRTTWYATEYNEEEKRFFGFIVSPLGEDCDEWGYFYLQQLEETYRGWKPERDLYFLPTKASLIPQITLYGNN